MNITAPVSLRIVAGPAEPRPLRAKCSHTDAEKLLDASIRCPCCRTAALRALIDHLREELVDRHDVVDGDYGEPAPNWAMHLTTLIDTELERIGLPTRSRSS